MKDRLYRLVVGAYSDRREYWFILDSSKPLLTMKEFGDVCAECHVRVRMAREPWFTDVWSASFFDEESFSYLEYAEEFMELMRERGLAHVEPISVRGDALRLGEAFGRLRQRGEGK